MNDMYSWVTFFLIIFGTEGVVGSECFECKCWSFPFSLSLLAIFFVNIF